MPKVTFGVHRGGRIRIEVDYEDYKVWEALLLGEEHPATSNFEIIEHTTIADDGSYWKTLHFRIGETEYRIGGPVMGSRRDE